MIKTRYIKPILALLILAGFKSISATANDSAVILQYHHVSNATPASTSVSPEQFEEHLQWLQKNDFHVLPLEEMINAFRQKKAFSHHKIAAISFDDAGASVCSTAWPILKKFKMPFTVFISSEMVDQNYASQCSWKELKEMYQSGLMTPANHAHRHLNMISKNEREKPNWAQNMKEEITTTQRLIEQKIGYASQLFAYPYGEYNQDLAKIVTEMDYTGFGQQSGALGPFSDFSALPRFPASGRFANLETLSTKLLSLAFPASFQGLTDNPVDLDGAHNPPVMRISANDASLLKQTQCFNSQGEPISVVEKGETLEIQAKNKLERGRHRYTCTRPSHLAKRFYWYSHQWLVE